MNSLPTGLVAATVSQSADVPLQVTSGILIGIDLGPNLSVSGSLATILWLSQPLSHCWTFIAGTCRASALLATSQLADCWTFQLRLLNPASSTEAALVHGQRTETKEVANRSGLLNVLERLAGR